MTGLCYLPLGV